MAIHWRTRRADDRTTRWIGWLFAIGSTCFLVGPFPGFVDLVGAEADAAVFFAGSIFFTTAAFLQARTATERDRLPTLIQLVGTVYFNVNTFRALQSAIDDSAVDRLIWRPDAIGSICFLVSGLMAFWSVRHERGKDRREWRIAAINLLGCILFGVSAIASYVLPDTGDVLDLAAANWSTGLGALCFLIGSLMLLPRSPSR
jgi:hypothetical protein